MELGWPSVLVRFACHIPFGMVAFESVAIWSKSRGLHLDDTVKQSDSIIDALGVFGVGGCIAFAYNFILFAASMFCSGYVLLFVGLADLFIAGLLSFGVHRLADVVPRTYGACSKIDVWRSNTDGKNFFIDAYEEAQWKDFSAMDLCQSMVRIWACAIAIIVLYGLCGCLNMLIGLLTCSDRSYYGRSYGPGFIDRVLDFACDIPTHVVDMIVSTLNMLGRLGRRVKKFVLHDIPRPFLKAKELLASRRATSHESKVEMMGGYTSDEDTIDGATLVSDTLTINSVKEKSKMDKVTEDDIEEAPAFCQHLIPIAKGMHFTDISDVANTSQGIGTAHFDADPATRRLQVNYLRRYTCSDAIKSKCGLCNVQICSGCWAFVPREGRHIQRCKPWCGSCHDQYYSTRPIKEQEDAKKKHKKECTAKSNHCAPSGPNPDDIVCPPCLQRLQAADLKSDKRGSSERDLACDRCASAIPFRGLTVWICDDCGTKCGSKEHFQGRR